MLRVGLTGGIGSGKSEVSRRLAEGFGIEAPVFPWRDRGFLRLSAQAYNSPSEYERLAHALPEVLRDP